MDTTVKAVHFHEDGSVKAYAARFSFCWALDRGQDCSGKQGAPASKVRAAKAKPIQEAEPLAPGAKVEAR